MNTKNKTQQSYPVSMQWFHFPGRVDPVFNHTPKTQKSYTSRIVGTGPGGTFFLVRSASSKPDAIILGDSAGALALASLKA